MNEGVKSNVSFGNKQIQQYIKPEHNKIYFSLSLSCSYNLCSFFIA